MISALNGNGVDDLKTYLAGIVPEGPWHYSEDDVTDLPHAHARRRDHARAIYHWLHEELPYSTTVETDELEGAQGRLGAHRADDLVERESQSAIVLGKGGADDQADFDASRARSCPRSSRRTVHLFLFVKVREDWGNDPERYREMGLDFPKKK